MIIIKTLLSSVLTLTLFSAITMAADSNSHAERQQATSTPLVKTASAANGRLECKQIVGNSTANAWNTGEICFATDTHSSKGKRSSSSDLRAANSISQNRAGSSSGAECISAGGSTAMTEAASGFCMASDLNTAQADVANFSVDNGLSVAGMQFLQATFSDGSTQTANAPISSECISAGGSTPFTANAEGFCLVSDLSRSLTDFARFSVANALPVVGVQFLQIKLNTNLAGGSGAGSKCRSVGGTTAAAGGFCLASDLSTGAAVTNFSVAHSVPATDMHFLQVTFGSGGQSGGSPASPGAGAPLGVECISTEGSVAAAGSPEGFCMVSDLIRSSIGSANITIANGSPVTGLQFLQATFGTGGAGGSECVSPEGSTASSGNTGGFCLVSDLMGQTLGSTNFSVANASPVTSWEFIQVPSSTGTPVGVVVSDSVTIPFEVQSASARASSVSSQKPFFHISDQAGEMEEFSTPYWRLYPHLGIWAGRR